MRNLTPSRLRTSATAAAAFMIHSPRVVPYCPASPRGTGLSYARPDDPGRTSGSASRSASRGGGPAGRGRASENGDVRMTRDELKQRVSETIERHADEIVAVGEAIRRHPELGFKELRTSALVETKFRQLCLAPRTGLAITGVRADAAGGAGPGPTFAL